MKKEFFEIKIQAKSEVERAARVKDSEARGFEVVRYFEYEKEGNTWFDGGYRNRAGAKYRHLGSDSRKFYGAVMRRPNDDFIRKAAASDG